MAEPSDKLSRIAAESKALLIRIEDLRKVLGDAISQPVKGLEILAKLKDVEFQANTIDKIAQGPAT